MTHDFAEYRQWLQSDEYRVLMAKLLGEQSNPPRTGYRIVDPESVDALTDRAAWHFSEAARLLMAAGELREQMKGVL